MAKKARKLGLGGLLKQSMGFSKDTPITLKNMVIDPASAMNEGPIMKPLAKIVPKDLQANRVVASYTGGPHGFHDDSIQSYIDPYTGRTVKYKKGGKVKNFSSGGEATSSRPTGPTVKQNRGGGIESRGKTRGRII